MAYNGALKRPNVKKQDLKMADQVARHENAEPENKRPENDKPEIVRHEMKMTDQMEGCPLSCWSKVKLTSWCLTPSTSWAKYGIKALIRAYDRIVAMDAGCPICRTDIHILLLRVYH